MRHHTSLRILQQEWSESSTSVPKILWSNNYCNVRTKCEVTIQASCRSGQRPAAGSQSSGSIKCREFYEPFQRDTVVWSSSACSKHISLRWKITPGHAGESCKSITYVLNLLYMNCTFQEKKATTFSSCSDLKLNVNVFPTENYKTRKCVCMYDSVKIRTGRPNRRTLCHNILQGFNPAINN
jgi:hypothetical protein